MKRFATLIVLFLAMALINGPPTVNVSPDTDQTEISELVAGTVLTPDFNLVENLEQFLPGGLELKLPVQAWNATIDIEQPFDMLLNNYDIPDMEASESTLMTHNMLRPETKFLAQIQLNGDLTRLDIGEHYKC